MITNERGILVYVNPAWCKTYGYSSEEAVGQTPRLLRSPYQDDQFYSQLWSEILDPQKGFWKGELVNRSKDGKDVTVLLTITPYRETPSSKAKGYMGIAVDLTAQKEMELKILQQDRLASVGQVASSIAHEVGTPLGVIRGRAEFLAMSAEEDSQMRKGLDVIINQIDRISKLIRSFLRASRSPGDIVVMPLNVSEAIDEVVMLIRQSMNKLGIELTTRVPDALLIYASGTHLQQVLLNLVLNAQHAIEKAMEEGQKNHFIKIEAIEQPESVLITIKDSGCGITPDVRQKLFRPFFTTKDIGKGTGLGLAISAQILHEMKGSIDVASPGLNQGSTFSITLPKATRTLIAQEKN